MVRTKQDSPNFANLKDKWPSPYVARRAISEFTGGAYSPKTMANLDSQGKGPSGAIRCGGKIVYPVESMVVWLAARSKRR